MKDTTLQTNINEIINNMRIFIATGEVSGDIQGALLAKKIKELDPSIILDG